MEATWIGAMVYVVVTLWSYFCFVIGHAIGRKLGESELRLEWNKWMFEKFTGDQKFRTPDDAE